MIFKNESKYMNLLGGEAFFIHSLPGHIVVLTSF